LVNIVLCLLQLGLVIPTFVMIVGKKQNSPDFHLDVSLFTLVLVFLIQPLAIWLQARKPDQKEKFCLMVQGSHQRKENRHRTTVYGVTITDELKVEYERNPEGILVFLRKLPSEGCNSSSGWVQPFSLPFLGWFPFLQFLCFATLTVGLSWLPPLSNHPDSIPLVSLYYLVLAVQVAILLTTYLGAEDCGYFFCCSYTRWFKHTSAYTEVLQDQILDKFGQQLKEEGEQLELEIRQHTTTTTNAEGVEIWDVGPLTKKRYDDQVRLLHLFLAVEHEKAQKKAMPETMETGEASFIMTREEMDRLAELASACRREVEGVNTPEVQTEATMNRTMEVNTDSVE